MGSEDPEALKVISVPSGAEYGPFAFAMGELFCAFTFGAAIKEKVKINTNPIMAILFLPIFKIKHPPFLVNEVEMYYLVF